MVAAEVFYVYGNYSDVPKLFVYSLLQQKNEIRENGKITVLDVVTLITLLVGKPPSLVFICLVHLDCRLVWAGIFCCFVPRKM